MCSDLLRVRKWIFQTLNTNNYQCLQASSTCQVRNILFEEQKFRFFNFGRGIYVLRETKKINLRLYWRCVLSKRKVCTLKPTKLEVFTTVKVQSLLSRGENSF